jgi:serine phosphatase RsbU (regulator of sigma subunit)
MNQHHMQCMEVWGGNQVADSGVVMAGLDAWVYSKPFGGADGGGDVYYVSSCATGRITRLLVADVSGHGQRVAQTGAALRTLMRKHVNQIDQTRFVRSMNEQFVTLSRAGSFATAVVTTFFSPTNSLSLCNAGHPPPLLYRAASKRWEYLDHLDHLDHHATASQSDDATPGNVPLGVLDLADYEQFDVRLKVGDLVLCYTDSLIEARDKSGEMLGPAGLLELVRSLDVSDPSRLTSQLLATVETRCGQQLCEDDVTVLLFRPNGLAPTTPLKERILAPFRVLRSFAWPDLNLANIGGAIFSPLNRLWARQRERRGLVEDR